VNSDASPNAASLLNAVDQAYGITPRDGAPVTSLLYFILQVSNMASDQPDDNAYASVTLWVNGNYYVFGNQWNSPITPQLNQSWGTLPSSDPQKVVNSSNLDKFFSNGAISFTTTQVLINGYRSYNSSINQPNSQTICVMGSGYTFKAGHSYNVIVNAVNKECEIKMMN
jgi:hypothetical protein